jgi:hypothetical protein
MLPVRSMMHAAALDREVADVLAGALCGRGLEV